MKPLTVIVPDALLPYNEEIFTSVACSDLVENILVVGRGKVPKKIPGCRVLRVGALASGETLSRILNEVKTKHILLIHSTASRIFVQQNAIERFLQTAEFTGAGIVYSDFREEKNGGDSVVHPLNDYQRGSVRDNFDFGHMMLFSYAELLNALKRYGEIPNVQYAGLYDLRLKLSIDTRIYHIDDPLYSVTITPEPPRGEDLFSYVDPRNQAVQKEMEAVFTSYLKKIGAYLPARRLKQVKSISKKPSLTASVIIPVKNRKSTISDALESALSQETDFPFNVIVVDNHSSDGTTGILNKFTLKYPQLKHIVPSRTDLGIGGCWNEAVQSEACGQFTVQLDSDDLYQDSFTLQRIIHTINEGRYAMVVGSYTLVNERMEEVPPGVVDHREWTAENGHNNALRINGLGAPRAFNTSVIRSIGFPDVSYGEDYAVALRISREFRIGRIYKSLYLCRRWPGNTDAALSIEAINRNDAYKDMLRTDEIEKRKMLVKGFGK